MRRKTPLDFDLIYLEYKDYIFRTSLLYLKDYHLAEDCTQNVLIKIYRKIHTFKGKSSLKTWITGICINTCKDMLKKRKHVQNIDETIPDKSADFESLISVTEAVMSLPLQIREVVILYYYREFTMKEVAQITHTKISNVEYRIRRAKTLLKEKLGDDFCE
ncbi:MAG: sigma-70 family RNA polymerase sigma factor [Ruminococcus sp.]|nr:sigma-70 family RNA polymerase sigma factor [Ruminococcus sp.]